VGDYGKTFTNWFTILGRHGSDASLLKEESGDWLGSSIGNIQDLNRPYCESSVTWIIGVLLGSTGMLLERPLYICQSRRWHCGGRHFAQQSNKCSLLMVASDEELWRRDFPNRQGRYCTGVLNLLFMSTSGLGLTFALTLSLSLREKEHT
jgi:hypothetical protein